MGGLYLQLLLTSYLIRLLLWIASVSWVNSCYKCEARGQTIRKCALRGCINCGSRYFIMNWKYLGFKLPKKYGNHWHGDRISGNMHICTRDHDFPQSMCEDEFGPTYRHFVIMISFIIALTVVSNFAYNILSFHKLHERKDSTIIDTTAIIWQ